MQHRRSAGRRQRVFDSNERFVRSDAARLCLAASALTEGAFRALCRMQVTFKRKKGEYFAHYAFGTSITPDSDQMLRIGTLALQHSPA